MISLLANKRMRLEAARVCARGAKRAGERGFTLLEVLISIALLAFISIFIYQATTESFKVREILSTEGEFFNSVRMAVSVINRDVSVAYSPTMLLAPSPAPQQGQNPGAGGFQNSDAYGGAPDQEQQMLQTGEYARTSQFWGPAVSKIGIRPSRFMGTETKMSFLAASHIRLYKAKHESDFVRVEYDIKPEKQTGNGPTLNVLVKTFSPNAFTLDDAKDTLISKVELLEGIERLKFRYYMKDKDTWLNNWDSENSEQYHRFPDMVELTIDVKGPGKLHFNGIYKLKPEMPINGIPAIF